MNTKITKILLIFLTIILILGVCNSHTNCESTETVRPTTTDSHTSPYIKTVNDTDTTTNKILNELEIPKYNSFKSYTDYHMLNKNSTQWKLQKLAYTDDDGLRRIRDYYLVALGTYYSQTLGDCFKIILDNGNSFKVCLCDIKSDIHTDVTHQYTMASGCMLEFYVDIDKLDTSTNLRGDISAISEFNGKVVKIERLEVNLLDDSRS